MNFINYNQIYGSLNNFNKSQAQLNNKEAGRYQLSNNTSLSQFKHKFSQTLKKYLNDFSQTYAMTDKQLCLCLTSYFSVHNQNIFWEHVHSEIPNKTSQQLKQYFQKSFSKCKFEIINNSIKLKIKEMTRAMPQSKPSKIVDLFFAEIENKVYFRREVLMLVQYFQRTE
ncbi:Hypothetical_protein [Hexamita inflata]|uniref:Hypothetical_protein n=1 Tax=Hexamita inflata TaxID=28002 RepID=A0AA86TQ90_9EUKA|nr:Hypothetical protein HINF_LOCUS12331 [Hexamita inflata]